MNRTFRAIWKMQGPELAAASLDVGFDEAPRWYPYDTSAEGFTYHVRANLHDSPQGEVLLLFLSHR